MHSTDNNLTVDDRSWGIAVKREAVLRTFLKKGRLSAEEVATGCRALAIKPAYFYRLLDAYKRDQRVCALLPRKPGPSHGSHRLPDKIEEIIQNAIREHYLSRQKPRASKLRQLIALEAHKAGLACPSRKAIDLRLKRIHPGVLLAEREGAKAAADKIRPVTGSLQAQHPLQIVQADHTKVDVFVVDEKHRLPIQRPWLTLLIDVATRMVAGYYLSLEPPSSVSVALALQHTVLPKDEWLLARGISAPWPVQGLPQLLHMDNAKEFHAKALTRGAEEYGIKLFYRPVATPHYGGHIERLIGTMMGEVHLLPGTTFSDIAERGSYDAEHHAAMTLKELDHWLAIQIVGRYHQEVHRSLARPPIAVWEELAAHPDVSIRHPEDQEHFFCDFLPYVERKIGRDGVSLFGIKYWESVLSVWAGASQRRFVTGYDPRDRSAIFVQSPEGSYWKVRYRNLGNPAIALWEHKRARKALLEQGRSERNEQMLFDAIEAQRLLVEDAVAKTKSARRQHQRTQQAVALSAPPMQSERIEAQNPTAPAALPVLPYDIEDWA